MEGSYEKHSNDAKCVIAPQTLEEQGEITIHRMITSQQDVNLTQTSRTKMKKPFTCGQCVHIELHDKVTWCIT